VKPVAIFPCKMNEILKRSITGVIFITLVIGSLYLGSIYSFFVLGSFMLIGLNEFYNFFQLKEEISLNKFLLFTYAILIYSLLFWAPTKYFPIVFPPLFFIFILFEIWRKKDNPLLNLGVSILAFIYVTIPFSILSILNTSLIEKSFVITLGMFLLIWSNDTFAYLSGRLMGKTKLFERISPKKTWEGTIGGVLMTVLISYLIFKVSGLYTPSFWMISALIISPCAILGDLLESLFKRSLGIKDSGTILPGHGGVLDRFDAALLTAPIYFSWILFYQYHL
jgi:phosphatidate cytidylyltransferase